MNSSNQIITQAKNLEKIRTNSSKEKFRSAFFNMATDNPLLGVAVINSEYLTFPSLIVLQPEIKKLNLSADYCLRNKTSIEIVDAIISGRAKDTPWLTTDSDKDVFKVLKWMLETGWDENGLSADFNEVLDKIVIILLKVFKDVESLKTVENLIFDRHRKGGSTYDLLWAFLESADPKTIIKLLPRLRSSDKNDVILARKLLSFIPVEEANNELHYKKSLKWLNKNKSNLNSTGESFLQKSNPMLFELKETPKKLRNSKKGVKK